MEDVFESLKTFKCDVTPIPWGGGVAGEFNSFYGKEHTKESRDLISKNRKNKCLGNSNGFTKENSLGENNYCYGKYGKEHPAYGHIKSEEFKQYMSNRVSGDKNPMYGKFGELNPNSKFTEQELKEISNKFISGMSRNEIYTYYEGKYSLSTIKRVIKKYE